MRGNTGRGGILALLAFAILVVGSLPSPARANAMRYQKISDLEGDLVGPLEDNALFGAATAYLGDINGDGLPEVAVGQLEGPSPGRPGTGAVWILSLHTDGTVAHEKVINGADLGDSLLFRDSFGTAVVDLGDLDGPGGYARAIAIGAPGWNAGRSGTVWILFLDSAGNVAHHRRISAANGIPLLAGDTFGGSLSRLGDLDGAGPSVEVLAVGAVGEGGECIHPPSEQGAVWLLFLDSSGGLLSFRRITEGQSGFDGALDCQDYFGESCAWLGDLDGPGGSVAALAVGAFWDDDAGLNSGAVWILFLNADGTVSRHEKINGLSGPLGGALDEGDRFGQSADAAGDMDGDGVTDLVVGADGDDDGDQPAPGTSGAVYILYMNTDGTVKAYQKISKTHGGFGGEISDNEAFGTAVSRLGDLDGDGVRDLCVGQCADFDGGPYRGAVWVLLLPHLGGCCFDSYCRDLWEVNCGEGRGDYQGDAVVCEERPCPPPPSGACCFFGYCVITPECDCASNGGVYLGNNALCAQDTCTTGPQSSVPITPATLERGVIGTVSPNPTSGGATLRLVLPQPARVRASIVDASGRFVASIDEERLSAGASKMEWSGLTARGEHAPSGVYFFELSVDGRVEKHRVVLVR